MKLSRPTRALVLLAPLSLLFQSCFLFASDDDDDDYEPEPFVETIDYAEPSARYLPGRTIAPNDVTNSADIPANATYSTMPELPDGLSIDGTTGTISGTPTTETSRRVYSVEAHDGGLVGMGSVVIVVVPPTPPSGLTYATNPASYILSRTISRNRPTYTGVIESFAVSPPLPPGLLLDPVTGDITGRPSEERLEADYRVTGTNPFGDTSVDVRISILSRPNARSLYLADGSDPLLLTYVADSFPGNTYQRGYELLPANVADIAIDVRGRHVHVLDLNGDIRAYQPQTDGHRLVGGAVVASVAGATRIEFDAGGDRLLVLAPGALSIFDVGPLGALSGQETVPALNTAVDLLAHPAASFAYVSGPGSLDVFSFSGTLTRMGGLALTGTLEDLAAPGSGDLLYAADTSSGRIWTFLVDTSAADVDSHLDLAGTIVDVPGGQVEDLAATGDGDYLFASTGFNGTVEAFRFDDVAGQLTHDFSEAIGTYITELRIDPDSRLLHALDIVEREIIVYLIGSLAISFSDRTRTRQAPTTMELLRGERPYGVTDHVFVSNATQGTIDTVHLDRSTTTLHVGAQVTPGGGPQDVVVHDPLGAVYVPLRDSGTIAMFTLDRVDTTLVPMNPPSAFVGEVPTHIVVGAAGRFAYVVEAGGLLIVFAIDPGTGVLTATGGFGQIAQFAGPPVVDPTGQFLYVLEPMNAEVAAFELDLGTGAPSPIGRATAPAAPSDMIMSPQGREVYVLSAGSSVIASLAIDPIDGSLTRHGTDAVVGAMSGSFDIMKEGFNIYAGSAVDGTLTILNVDFDTGVPDPFGGSVSPVMFPAGFSDLRMDRGDLFLFAAFTAPTSQLILYRGQPTESMLQVDAVPIAAGDLRVGVNLQR